LYSIGRIADWLKSAVELSILCIVFRFESHIPPYVMAELRSHVDMVNNMFSILVFIAIIGIVIGVIWGIYVYWKRDSFAENILKLLSLLP
jgi:ABC-type dipeptide/oligopeptide/nickel transport system permease component